MSKVLFPCLTRDRIRTGHINQIDKVCFFAAPCQARGQDSFYLQGSFGIFPFT